jgi:hypothetical protein
MLETEFLWVIILIVLITTEANRKLNLINITRNIDKSQYDGTQACRVHI